MSTKDNPSKLKNWASDPQYYTRTIRRNEGRSPTESLLQE